MAGIYNDFGGSRMTPCVKNILLVTVGCFFLQIALGGTVEALFALRADWFSRGLFWQPVSYIFLHDRRMLMHILLNMYGLYLLGPAVESTLGSRRFAVLYFLSGILGGIGWALLSRFGTCVGASGAVYGVLFSYAALYPQARMRLIFPPIELKAWQLVTGLALIEFFQTMGLRGGIVANAAHLAGGVAGFCYAMALVYRHESWRVRRMFPWLDRLRRTAEEWKRQAASGSVEEVDRILEKIAQKGIGSLTPRERRTLKEHRPQ